MGKNKSGSASEAAKVSRDWSASAITNRDINKLRALGFISASEDDVRLPGQVSRPSPPKGFTVMFVAFLFRGLSLPAHEFLRSLLFFYGIQLWQLTPNSILHLSIFITVCEAFLGIEPHWGLWRKIFYVKRHNDSNGPPVVGGVGFVVRKEVDYFDYPMKESVQGWRNKWFYLRDPAVQISPFLTMSWNNALSLEEKGTTDELFKQIVILKNSGGMTMRGTEVVSVFLQRRVQPLMSRPHQLWLFAGKNDKSRVNSADLSADELQNEVRRLTCLSTKDTIVLTSARPPYDSKHPPSEVPAVAQCYPPSPESGAVLEDDDDDSEGTEDTQHALEDSDVQEEETAEDDAFLKSRRRKQVHDDLITSAESSPKGGDNDADEAASPPPAKKGSTSFFVDEDDLDLQFTLQSMLWTLLNYSPENSQLRKAVKSSADQVVEANRLATDAKSENASLKEEVSRLKRQMKDDQDARRAAAAAIDEKEGVLRESIKDLLEAANLTVSRRHQLREDSTADALSLAAESNVQILRLLQKSKGALSKLYSMIFPKAKLDKTLDEMAKLSLSIPPNL
ncbi:hypothetical protein QYE76_062368 [Lolium multiflorum]|uniref:Transposase (putative) gypsy type domain-containing protein n=1 Tax=Lolium multiflorum TaxID=4521 RepID=A0AAD8S4C9_LOLMU|nr:hypothetical protein QYE76_062368 [Lolium multiflorum]